MKQMLCVLLALVLSLSLMGCGNRADTAMQTITLKEAAAALTSGEYVFFDVRKAADSSEAIIPYAWVCDMDAAVQGDFQAGVAVMEAAVKDLDKKIILVCNEGERHAQLAANALAALGYDMTAVYNLEGGFQAWCQAYPYWVAYST